MVPLRAIFSSEREERGGERKHTRHVDIINPPFYSHIRFCTTISHIHSPLRDPRHFHDCHEESTRARKQGIKKGVAVLWRNFLCAFKMPRATRERGMEGVRVSGVTLWTTKISFPVQFRLLDEQSRSDNLQQFSLQLIPF